MSDTPEADKLSWICDCNREVAGAEDLRVFERLLRECYNSGGLSPDLMKRVGEVLGE